MRSNYEKHIIVIGAGFGGLSFVNNLKKNKDLNIIIIDKNNYTLFQPFLYQVATCKLAPSDIAVSLRSQFKGYSNINILMDKVCKINSINKEIQTESGLVLKYDYLIIATGSENNFFGNDEWAKYVISLKTIHDAIEIRNSLLKAFEQAKLVSDSSEKKKLLSFLIIGGGPTGVELAGSIREFVNYSLKYDFSHILYSDVNITLIEAGSRILSSFDESLSEAARISLLNQNINVQLNSKVKNIEKEKIYLESGEVIQANLLIWAAGIKATNLTYILDKNIELGIGNKIIVNNNLSLPSDPDIFIIGDLSQVSDKDGKILPSLAAVANQQGKFIARLMNARIKGNKFKEEFLYKNWGNLAIISRHKAIIEYKNIKLKGSLAWLIWNIIHIYFLIGFRNRIIVFIKWMWNYFNNNNNENIILELDK